MKFSSQIEFVLQGSNGVGIQGIPGPRGEPGEKVKEIQFSIHSKKFSRSRCLNSCVSGEYWLHGTSWPKGNRLKNAFEHKGEK